MGRHRPESAAPAPRPARPRLLPWPAPGTTALPAYFRPLRARWLGIGWYDARALQAPQVRDAREMNRQDPPMAGTDQTRLLQFASDLQRAVSFTQLLEIVREAVESLVGYRHAWLAMVEPNLTHVRILAFVGVGTSWDEAVVVPIAGDAMVAEILKGAAPIVVEDARTDPRTNKEMVKVLGNRTIINVPLSLVDVTLGMLGVGTMGDEGVRPPTPEDLEVLMAMAAQVSVAAGRLRWIDERARAEREKAELNRRLFQAQKLESLGLLAGGVAHDFNNLLQVIIGDAHFLSQDDLSESQREVVSDVLAAADRGMKLSRQLLAMGRKQAQSLEAVDVNARLGAL